MVEPGVISAITQAVEKDPENVDLRLSLASLLIDSGQARIALDHCMVVLGRGPDFLEPSLDGAFGETKSPSRTNEKRSSSRNPLLSLQLL